MAPKLIIFDWDGVINHNSMQLMYNFIADAAMRDFPQITDKDEFLSGIMEYGPIDEAMGYFSKTYSVANAAEWFDKITTGSYEKIISQMMPTKNVLDLLCQLGPVAVATNGNRLRTVRLAETFGLADYFNEGNVFSAIDIGVMKPDPAVFEFAAEKLSVPKAEILVVEDSNFNIKTAKLAGFKTFGYIGAEHLKNRQEQIVRAMYEAGADYISNDLLDILEVMEIEK